MKWIAPPALALLLLLDAGCGSRRVVVKEVHVKGPPPRPPAVVVVKPRRPGKAYVWVKGHYVYRSGRYVWVKGRWIKPARRGAVWVPGHWRRGKKGGVWVRGHWR